MHTLNFLPEPQKKELATMTLLRLGEGLCILLVVLLIIVSVILGIVRATLQRLADSGENTLATKEQDIAKSIAAVRHELAELAVLADAEVWLSPKIAAVASAAEPGIRLSVFTIDAGTKTASLQGNADTRNTLLSFERKLKDSGAFTEVTVPLESLAAPRNIPFTISIRLSDIIPIR